MEVVRSGRTSAGKREHQGNCATGFGTEQDVQRSKEAGFDFHLVRPIDFQELQTVLDQSDA